MGRGAGAGAVDSGGGIQKFSSLKGAIPKVEGGSLFLQVNVLV